MEECMKSTPLDAEFLGLAEHSLRWHHLPRIERCLETLSREQVWWRPNKASNSAGNLVLHLAGNVRQWIVAGLGGAPDTRDRDMGFAERGPLPSARLVRTLRSAVLDACKVLRRLTASEMAAPYTIQKLSVTGLNAVLHVVEHFAFHSGQIIFITKQLRSRDLHFTRLPSGVRRSQPARPRKARVRELPLL
jgi:uncharacterized damage-inducible protein DinB